MRKIHPPFLVFSACVFLLTSSCQTTSLSPPPTLPSDSLRSLFEIKQKAEADGRYLKEAMKNQERLSDEATDEATPNLANGRIKYNDVYSSFNATIKVIQQSLRMGNELNKEELDNQIKLVKSKQERLARYVKQKLGTTRKVTVTEVKKTVKVAIEIIDNVWEMAEGKRDEERKKILKERQKSIDSAIASLEEEKMVSFKEL